MYPETTKTYPLYTVREASILLGVSTPTVYKWLREGALCEAATAGSVQMKFVDGESLERLRREREGEAGSN